MCRTVIIVIYSILLIMSYFAYFLEVLFFRHIILENVGDTQKTWFKHLKILSMLANRETSKYCPDGTSKLLMT